MDRKNVSIYVIKHLLKDTAKTSRKPSLRSCSDVPQWLLKHRYSLFLSKNYKHTLSHVETETLKVVSHKFGVTAGLAQSHISTCLLLGGCMHGML